MQCTPQYQLRQPHSQKDWRAAACQSSTPHPGLPLHPVSSPGCRQYPVCSRKQSRQTHSALYQSPSQSPFCWKQSLAPGVVPCCSICGTHWRSGCAKANINACDGLCKQTTQTQQIAWEDPGHTGSGSRNSTQHLLVQPCGTNCSSHYSLGMLDAAAVSPWHRQRKARHTEQCCVSALGHTASAGC